jgi:hypothetical protein
MTLDEHLLYIATLQRSHDEQIGKLVEQGNLNTEHIGALARKMDVLTDRTIQAMDTINRLGRIVENHENRIDGLEGQRPS